METKKFKIVQTPCFPNQWKIETIGYRDNNATHLYHKTIENAQNWIKKFGGIKNPSIEIIYLKNI